MKLIKNSPKSYYPFIFQTDECIDWKASAKKVIENAKVFRENYEAGLVNFDGKEVTPEQVTQKFVDTAFPVSIYSVYQSSGFDHELIVGKHQILLFSELTTLDLQSLVGLVPKLKPLFEKAQTNKEINWIEFLGEQKTFEEVKEVIKEIFKLKLAGIEYHPETPKEDQRSPEEAIKFIFDEGGLQLEDIMRLKYFVEYMIKNMIAKKKILPSIAA